MATTQAIDGQIYFTNLPELVGGDFEPASGPGAGWFPFHIGLDTFDSVGLATGAHSPAGELEWETMRRFGDREMLDRFLRGEWPAPSTHETLSIHDLAVSRYNPWHAY